MLDTIFIIGLVAYLGTATTLLYRSPASGCGLPLFVLLFPVFLVAFFFVSSPVIAAAWFVPALINMPFQYALMKRTGTKKVFAGVLVASLFLWPLQFAAAVNSSETEKEEQADRETNREKIGSLPATVTGTVSYSHHHGTEDGHDSVWLEEYGELAFMTDSSTYDRLGIAEGKKVSLAIDEREAPEGLADGKVLWITGS